MLISLCVAAYVSHASVGGNLVLIAMLMDFFLVGGFFLSRVK